MRKLIIFFILLGIPYTAIAKTGTCIRITDGDTIVILKEGREIKLRLYGIDCPELNQPYGIMARQCVSDLMLDKPIRFIEIGKDRYGRIVAIVFISNTDVSLQEVLLKNGLAWIYPLYCTEFFCKDWEKLSKEAMLYGKGLWPTPPWIWRKNIEKRGTQQ